MGESTEKETRITLDGVPARVLMGIDPSGEKRILRCDEDGYLIVKTVSIDEEEIES